MFFDNLVMGFGISLSGMNLLYCLIGVVLGTTAGILPGLGPAATIALLLPMTFKMDVTSAIIMLSGIYYGVAYGGTLTSVLVNIPGEACTVVTCLDGYQMARKGRAGPALGMAAFGSFIACTFGIVLLMLIAPPLSTLALTFGPPEYAAMMVAGMTLVTYLSSKSIFKSLAMAVLGLMLGCVGLDPISGTERFTFGTLALMDGINIAPLAMGLFGISEVLIMAEGTIKQEDMVLPSLRLSKLLPTRKDWRDSAGPIARGSVLGFFLGILPGGGAVMASFMSYALEKRISKHPEKFGTGIIEGVAGPESANNAGTAGAFIPLLTLGLPFNVITALLLAAFMIHGITPGPFIIKESPEVFWGVITSMYVGNCMLLLLNLPLIGLFINILRVPYRYLCGLIGLICFVGAFSVGQNHMDVLLMIFFGIMGYLMKKFEFDAAPLILAFVLGPMLERSLRQSLILSDGSLGIFVSRPISVVMLVIAVVSLFSPLFKIAFKRIIRIMVRTFRTMKGGERASSN
jgi:putative tricarboxylic transport membrane protein